MTADAGPEPINGITKDELDVYDRQVRLWGLEAQNALRKSNVLLVGLSPLGAEVTKNLMLCGLGALTISDKKLVSEDDLVSNFLLQSDEKISRAVASAAKARALNPMVQFKALELGIADFAEEELKRYHLIILLDEPYDVVSKMDAFCRQNGIRFMAGALYGWYGYAFVDFNKHKFLMKQPKPFPEYGVEGEDGGAQPAHTTIEDDVFEKRELDYPSFEEAFNVDWTRKKFMRRAKGLVPRSYVYLRTLLRAEQQKTCFSHTAEMAQIFSKEKETVRQTELIPDWTEQDGQIAAGAQLSFAAAIVGGVMGQETIKALSEGECPLHNVFLYSAPHTTGHIVHYPPK